MRTWLSSWSHAIHTYMWHIHVAGECTAHTWMHELVQRWHSARHRRGHQLGHSHTAGTIGLHARDMRLRLLLLHWGDASGVR